jgi:hypothetical protein
MPEYLSPTRLQGMILAPTLFTGIEGAEETRPPQRASAAQSMKLAYYLPPSGAFVTLRSTLTAARGKHRLPFSNVAQKSSMLSIDARFKAIDWFTFNSI